MSTDPLLGSDPADLTARLEEVPGVAAAAVHLDEHGGVRSIRVAALDTPPLEQIRAGVEQVLLTMGIRLHPDAIRMGVLTAPPIQNGAAYSAFGPPSPPPTTHEPPATAERAVEHHTPLESPHAVPPPPGEGVESESKPPQFTAAGEEDALAQRPRSSGIGPSRHDDRIAEPAPWHGRFLLLDNLDVHADRTHCRCHVDLIRLEDRFEGSAEDLATEIGRARAAARATLAAARKAAAGVTLALEGVQVVPLFGRRYVALTVEAAADRRFQSLAALVSIDHSIEHAAAVAALRAIERWIAW